jgi:uncharacterized protein YuzE
LGSERKVKLCEALPEFSAELWASLAEAGYKDLAAQVADIEIERYTYDASCNAAYIYIRPAQDQGLFEKNINGIKHGEPISVEHPYCVNVDTDNFGRLTGIELLNGGEVARRLAEVLGPNHPH